MLIDGSKAKAAREVKGKKVAEIAVAVDMSATWLYALEGKTAVEVKAPTAHALARVLGVKVGELVPVHNQIGD